MHLNQYTVKALTSHHIAALNDQWLPYVAEHDALPMQAYEKGIGWVRSVVDGTANTEAEIFGILGPDESIAGVFDLIHVHSSSPKGYLKMVNLLPSPKADLAGADKASTFQAAEELSNIIATAVMYMLIQLQEKKCVCKVKFYASDRVTLRLMRKSFLLLDEEVIDEYGFRQSSYGNWMEFTRSDEQ